MKALRAAKALCSLSISSGEFVDKPVGVMSASPGLDGGKIAGDALVNVVISQGSARKPQQFRWHS